MFRTLIFALTPLFLLSAQPSSPSTDLSKTPTVYVIGYSHLDTQWRWDYPQTITEYLPKTIQENLALFEKYPHYVFNFSGANRYRMIREYFPADYARVKQAIAAGRWFPAGSSMEEGDVLASSSESILRQVLYGNGYFRREFGRASNEYLLPDCFGFPASLPSILAHAGLRGFSTQKLSGMWNSASGVPFNIGWWQGPDGRGVIGALNAGGYNSQVLEDLSKNEQLLKRVRSNGEKSGVLADYRYYGVGDTGGSPREPSVQKVELSATSDGPLHVVSARADQMFSDITPQQTAKLERYQGDLLLVEHSAGSLTSQSYMKQWNRHNELLAAAAERAAVGAELFGGPQYPRERMNRAWALVLGGQFHDILPGTASPKAYEYSWNDEVLAMNQFAGVVEGAVSSMASGLDTRGSGQSIVVYNPLSTDREDIVEARVPYVAAVRVTGADGGEVASQVVRKEGTEAVVLFRAKVPSMGLAVFDVAKATKPAVSALRVSESSIENARYKVSIDTNGDVSQIHDKMLQRDLLTAPIRLAFQTHKPRSFPAWNMDWEDQQKPPRGYVEGPAKVRIVENGAARVAVEVERETEGSKFVETVRLASGDAGNRIEFANRIDWKTKAAALKATFPLSASNAKATYNYEPGTIERGNNDPKKYEVPSHEWFDLTDQSGSFGVTVLSGSKYGSDKPDDRTLRLTLLYTPGTERQFPDQATQDWGHHEFVYGLAAHAGSEWQQGQAARMAQPLMAFAVEPHPGAMGKQLSLARVSDGGTRVMAFKKAEATDELMVRLVEVEGKKKSGVKVTFASAVTAAREVDGQEQSVGAARAQNGVLVTDLEPYGLRSFAVKLSKPAARVATVKSQAVKLSGDVAVASNDGEKVTGGFDGEGRSLPAEMLPSRVEWNGVAFEIGPRAVIARGQTVDVPAGYRHAYVLAASAKGDVEAAFDGERAMIQSWTGFIGQWDNRQWKEAEAPSTPAGPGPGPGRPPRGGRGPGGMPAQVTDGFSNGFGAPSGPGTGARPAGGGGMGSMMASPGDFAGLTPGFIKPAPVAWFASHHHAADGRNVAYEYAYLYAYRVAIPQGAKSVKLPDNESVRILAITVADDTRAIPMEALVH